MAEPALKSEYNVETLRREMIRVFHEFTAIPVRKEQARTETWEYYCECRERYLEQYSQKYGTRYIPLHLTMLTKEP